MTTSIDAKALFHELLNADTEAAVVKILSREGFWQDKSKWRYLGDQEHNFSTVGGQQRLPEQALIEKLVNSIDTKLISAARLDGLLGKSGSDNQHPDIPTSIAEARQRFFDKELSDLPALSRCITVAATGAKPREGNGRPCFTIVDNGEGQTPAAMPETILSLHKGNKDKIKFVQGKFNMGGTGVLEFCGIDHNVQLVISRRHPDLIEGKHSADHNWSFTVIRREDPENGRSSRYTYLAPLIDSTLGNTPEHQKLLLNFDADTLPLFPDKNKAYVRETKWGTLIKLYEYEAKRFGTNMMMSDGLMYRVRLLLTAPALPIRFHECRAYRGVADRSFDTTMTGLLQTLKDDLESDKRDNVEWFDRQEFDVDGSRFMADIYLFKDKAAASSYKKDEGLIFTLNGQAHAILSKDFFRRTKVKQDYLWHSLLVVVNCDDIGQRGQEKLFMNSRDGLRDGELKRKLESELEDLLGNHQELKTLASERRKREIADKTTDDSSMAKVIETLLAKNPAIAAILGKGMRIRNPHKPQDAGDSVAGFIGRRFPTTFHFKGMEAGAELSRNAHLESRVRIAFETDAGNDYFKRDDEPGEFRLYRLINGERKPATNYHRPRLLNGLAHLSLSLPDEASVDDVLAFEAEISDPSRIEPFTNKFNMRVRPEKEITSGGSNGRDKKSNSPGNEKGAGGKGQSESSDSHLGLPQPIPVTEADWDKQDPPFDRFTAVRVLRSPDATDDEDAWDYYINVDNVHLQNEIRQRTKYAASLKTRFSVAMTLVALALLHDHKSSPTSKESGTQVEIQDRIEEVTRALALFILPLVDSVSDLPLEEEALSSTAGEAA